MQCEKKNVTNQKSSHSVPDMHKEDELRPADVALGHDVGRDAEGREVGGRRNVVMHGDLWRDGSSLIICPATHSSTNDCEEEEPNPLMCQIIR